jgi:hypothetical protein
VIQILREAGSGPVVTAGSVVSGLERMFMLSSVVFLMGWFRHSCSRHCEEHLRRSNPWRGVLLNGLLRCARNDG